MTRLAIDLGATSGRATLGRITGGRLHLQEVYRFPNEPVRLGDRLHWDVLRLYHEVKRAIVAATQRCDGPIESLGIDAWGLDFGLVDGCGELLANPYHYRDAGTRDVRATAWGKVPRDEIFARTGIQSMPINSLYQLVLLARDRPALLEQASALLMIPDLIRFFLSGEQTNEYTVATTTQFLGLRTRDWDRDLLLRLDLPDHFLTPIVPPATRAGRLRPTICDELDVPAIPVVAIAEHDTASAVMATPGEGDFAYLSCGTLSLLGTTVPEPVVDARALAWNITNEGGLDGGYRLLKNIMGLWLIERCRESWATVGVAPSYEELLVDAARATPFAAAVDPDSPVLIDPPRMPDAIQALCRASGQAPPHTPGEVTLCIVESLALKTRLVLERIEALTGRHFAGLHIVGGGSRNALLCRALAGAIGRPVWSGPVEATTAGNVLAQLLAAGELGSADEGREIVRCSFSISTYEPADREGWDAAYESFLTRFCADA